MKYSVFATISLLFVLVGCSSEDDPFEFPESDVAGEPVFTTIVERQLDSTEIWDIATFNDGCVGNTPNVTFGSQNAVIQLIPDTNLCQMEGTISTTFKAEEISDVSIFDLEFEFTYNRLNLNPSSEFWLTWYYKELELELDLAPFLYNGVFTPNSGLFKVYFESGDPVIELNGQVLNPDFDNGSNGYHFSTSGSGNESYFSVGGATEGTDEETYIQFKYLRISGFVLPDA